MARSVMVWGTSSGAGKSWLATALCRWAAQQGVRVRPFKAQNMSNNARVVACPDGSEGEIGAAQYFQALAAGAEPIVDMNPVLLKPESETASQVVVHGRVDAALSRTPWRERSARLGQAARASFDRLARDAELIVIEGAGSPAEINLAATDYVNLAAARWAREAGDFGALLVTNIDLGGAFAHVHGTWALLPEDLRPALAGYVLNKFRGDARLLAPGPEMIERATGVPLAGVIPMVRDHGLPEEDGLHGHAPGRPARRRDGTTRIAIVCPPHISNLDEFQPLLQLRDASVAWVRSPEELQDADWIVLPGSKQVSSDLAWLRTRGLDVPIRQHAAEGRPVLGICGGLQMLGESLVDEAGHDGQVGVEARGLGLLPLATHYEAHKQLRRCTLKFGALQGPWAAWQGVESHGYEIHCGVTVETGPPPRALAALVDDRGRTIGWQRGSVLGVYAHGLLESPAVLRAMWGADMPSLDDTFDLLAAQVDRHLDRRLLDRLLLGKS